MLAIGSSMLRTNEDGKTVGRVLLLELNTKINVIIKGLIRPIRREAGPQLVID